MIEYKTWIGRMSNVILLSGDDLVKVLYYETGFEQLHPFPNIIDWMKKHGCEYHENWKVVREEPNMTKDSCWAICFENKKHCELFVLKWL